MTETLDVIARMIADLDAAEVSYCHWKSNRALDTALRGEGDLDLLVAEDDAAKFHAVVTGLGFIRTQSPPIKTFPHLVDYLGFDEASGELVHLHVHHRLVLGEQRVKNHHLPVERWLLTDVRTQQGVPVPQPSNELVLLYLRAHLKASVRSCLRATTGRARTPYPSGTWAEIQWLAALVDDERALAACDDAGLEEISAGFALFLGRLRREAITPLSVLRQKRYVLRQLRRYQRRRGPSSLAVKSWYRFRYSRYARRAQPIRKKTLPEGGLIVAVVGADGSGKSTLARDLQLWLAWKLHTRHFYLGQPKTSRLLIILRRGKRVARQVSRRAPSEGFGRGVARWGDRAASALEGLQWLHVARTRHRTAREISSMRAAGGIAIAERFPVRDLFDMAVPMDGPRLQRWRDADGLLGHLGRAEWQNYRLMGAADLELVLRADLQTLRERAPDTPPAEHAAKAAAVLALEPRAGRTFLDATAPYRDVLLRAKSAVWREVTEGHAWQPAAASTATERPLGTTDAARILPRR
jgi:hypothetical protein